MENAVPDVVLGACEIPPGRSYTDESTDVVEEQALE